MRGEGVNITETQMPERLRVVIDEQLGVYDQGTSIEAVESIPDTTDIPIEDPKRWLRIPDVVCVYVDMRNSTKLSAESHDRTTAGAYQLFSGTAVKLFSAFEAPYIDVRGDGVLALFDGSQPYRALAAAVTFKTFATDEFSPAIAEATDLELDAHIGIDQKTVLVRKLGFKRYRGRSDRQNEVWAGKPVNMAAKLASAASEGELLASDRYFANLKDEHAVQSCDCGGTKADLWTEVPVADLGLEEIVDFEAAWRLKSRWCPTHGNEYCEAILALEE